MKQWDMKQWVMRKWLLLFSTLLPGLLSGCAGYQFQGSHSPLLEKEGVRRVFVAPLVNNTYKAGIENLVYNALVRTLAAGKRVTLVYRPEDADAVLQGIVSTAQYVVLTAAPVSSQSPNIPTVHPNVQVATVYSSQLECAFTLNRRADVAGKRSQIWHATFARTKPFPSAIQLDVPGTTTALINDSEFERALSDLAADMMADVHESMLAQF